MCSPKITAESGQIHLHKGPWSQRESITLVASEQLQSGSGRHFVLNSKPINWNGKLIFPWQKFIFAYLNDCAAKSTWKGWQCAVGIVQPFAM